MYINMYIYIYIYMYTDAIMMCMYACVYIYDYIYISYMELSKRIYIGDLENTDPRLCCAAPRRRKDGGNQSWLETPRTKRDNS